MNTIRKSSEVFMDFFSTLLLALLYEYHGKAYDCNGDYKGDWYSDELTYLSEGGFRFYARGHFLENGNLLSTESSGYVIFRKNGRAEGDLKEAFKCLMDGCISKVKPGGVVVIVENRSIFGEQLSLTIG